MTSFASKYVRAVAVAATLAMPIISTSAARADVDITQTANVITNTGRMDFRNDSTGGTGNRQLNGVLVNNVNAETRGTTTIRQTANVITNSGRVDFRNTSTGGTGNTQANGFMVNNVHGGS